MHSPMAAAPAANGRRVHRLGRSAAVLANAGLRDMGVAQDGKSRVNLKGISNSREGDKKLWCFVAYRSIGFVEAATTANG